jgi:uracil-DNA glycosylase family 4
VFTGDASGDFLWPAMHAVGLADRPVSRTAGDGLTLIGTRIAAAVRCAPPANKPTPAEQATCRPYLVREIELLAELRVIVALGAIGWDAALRALNALGHRTPSPKPGFAHGAEVGIGPYALVGTYHPSQQNTFTGRLTPSMLQAVLERAVHVASA